MAHPSRRTTCRVTPPRHFTGDRLHDHKLGLLRSVLYRKSLFSPKQVTEMDIMGRLADTTATSCDTIGKTRRPNAAPQPEITE